MDNIYHPYIWPGGQSHAKRVAVRHSVTTSQLITVQSPDVSRCSSWASQSCKAWFGVRLLEAKGYGTPQDEVPGRSLKNCKDRSKPCDSPLPLHSLRQLISRPGEKKKQNGALAGCVLASHFGLQQFIGLIVHWLRRM